MPIAHFFYARLDSLPFYGESRFANAVTAPCEIGRNLHIAAVAVADDARLDLALNAGGQSKEF